MREILAAAFVTMAALQLPAHSQDVRLYMFVTGNELLERCTDIPSASTYVAIYGFCRGYVYAAADFYGTVAAENGRPSCRKAGVTGKQLVDMVIQYLRNNPQERHKPGDYSVIAVLPPLMAVCQR